MPASNTFDCFREFVGQRVTGTLQGGLHNHAETTKTLIFEDGRGLTINDNGSYWITSADDIKRAVDKVSRRLKTVQRDLREVLEQAGAA